jgi:hypothetical protein
MPPEFLAISVIMMQSALIRVEKRTNVPNRAVLRSSVSTYIAASADPVGKKESAAAANTSIIVTDFI